LIYEKIVRTSPPKRSTKSSNPFIIDINQLSSENYGYHHPNSAWESYYGATDFMSERHGRQKSSKFGDSYKSVFTSPYFDYRKTHSKVPLLPSFCGVTSLLKIVTLGTHVEVVPRRGVTDSTLESNTVQKVPRLAVTERTYFGKQPLKQWS
jgi:hypothetical protein